MGDWFVYEMPGLINLKSVHFLVYVI